MSWADRTDVPGHPTGGGRSDRAGDGHRSGDVDRAETADRAGRIEIASAAEAAGAAEMAGAAAGGDRAAGAPPDAVVARGDEASWAPERPPGPWTRLTAAVPLLRHTERELRLARRLWRTSVLSGVLTPLLFLGAMGLGLGDLVDEGSGDVAGVPYLFFVMPGILAATAMQTAAGNSLWMVMAGIKWVKTFHAAAATPLSPGDVYGGYVTWVGLRVTGNAVAFVAIAAALGAVPSPWGLLAVPAAAMTGLAFAAPLCAYSATQDNDLSFPIIMRIVVVPMFLLSGTFFPLDQLPVVLRPLAWVTPLWHGVELCRGATTGSLELGPAALHVGVLVACIAAGWWWGVRTFTRRLAP
ncbi:MAG TPA: ABC transporter permease [Acidimicrobiales bacterium]